MMARLEKVEEYSLAIPLAVAMALVGLIGGVLYAVGGAIYDVLKGQVGSGTALAFMSIVGMPIMFSSFGFLAGVIGAFLNNWLVGWCHQK